MAPMTPPSSTPRKRRVASPANGVKTPPLSRESAIPEFSPEDSQDGDKHDTSALLDEVDTHLVHNNGMLRLPSELLEMVASNLLDTTHIFNFGLVNKRLGGIVQATIVRELIASGRNIKGFLRMLSYQPELLNKVLSINLGDFGCSHHVGCFCADENSLDLDILEGLGAAISTTTGHTPDWSRVWESNASVGTVWRKEPAFSLNLLAMSCPNIKSVTVQLPEVRPFFSSQPPRPLYQAPPVFPALNFEMLPGAPFQGPALPLFQAKLEALTIAENTRWKGPPTIEVLESHDAKWRNMGSHMITLADFARLKRLDIPMGIIGLPDDIFLSFATKSDAARVSDALPAKKTLAEARSKVIPLTIQHLRLRSCNKWTFALLQRINEIPVSDLRLKYVELYFKTPCKQLIILCNAFDLGRLDYLDLLTSLGRKGIKVTFHSGSQEVSGGMRKELEAFYRLRPLEMWRCSGSSAPFCEWAPEASRQPQLAFGVRMFLRHADHHSQLLNSPTFDLRLWIQSAFFHGIRSSKWDPQLQEPNKKQATIDSSGWADRALGKRTFRRRLSPLLNLDTFQFTLRFEQKLAPLAKETLFLGASFVTTESTNAQSPDQYRDSTKKSCAKEEQTKRSKKAEITELASYITDKAQGLDEDIERLRLESVNIPMAAEFSETLWASVAWKILLQPKKKLCNKDCSECLGGM
ncbi:hypothetical protein J4E93_008780 [Alternaria ventricosa]|uniref:uncharacterized protein n=1 Tax=Alternaria ventricosa TaxID=1187951 RepID=UPI0020C2AA52|nr:uncharacterized protein J4E93_008780 [Alternaria ventricosa]KAI4639981.1 hypothetical protein J4E93_008780 [Alternaria ventricosa]